MMSTSTIMQLVTLFIIGYIGMATAQVSFSTHWGGGKRSSLFKAQPEANKAQPYFDTVKQSSLFDTENDIADVFRETNDPLQCLAKMEVNIIKYMTLVLENELRKARECVLADKDVDYN